MMDLADQLKLSGITACTVDVVSRRGGDTPNYPTKSKVYYRLRNDPAFGVLLIHETDEADAGQQCVKLTEEAANFQMLQSHGYDVPKVLATSIEVLDYIDGKKPAAALIVEHISGCGPYKAITEVSTIAKIVSQANDELRAKYLGAWDQLTSAAEKSAPMDMQVLLSDDGRIVTIDPEKVGPGKKLKPLV